MSPRIVRILCVAAGVLATGTLAARPLSVTNALTRVLSSGDDAMRTLMSANWTDGREAHAGADYVVGVSDAVRLPDRDYVFQGNSLQFGTAGVAATFAQKNGSLTFAHDGLFLRRGTWSHWAGGFHPCIHGHVTVLSSASAPVLFTSANADTSYEFTGAWHVAPGCGVDLRAQNDARNAHRMVLSGDLADFRGRIRVLDEARLVLKAAGLPGEVRVEGGSGPGCLEAAADVEVGTLTLAAGARLAPAILRAGPGGALSLGAPRVTGALSVSAPVTVVLPSGIGYLASTNEVRLPLLTLGAEAKGRLAAADFVLSNAVASARQPAMRLETAAGAEGTGLVLVLAADPSARGAVVAYEDFGAVGDGVADDFDAIVAAHAAANELGLPVRARDGATYYVGGAAKTALVRTDVDFGTARFVIDDTAVVDRNRHVFQIASDHASHVLSGLSRVVKGRRDLGVAPGRRSLLVVWNDNVKQFIRMGNNQNDGTAQREVLLVDARGVVEASCPMTWDFDVVTSVTAYPVDARTLTVKGGVFTTRANAETSEYRYFARGIAVRRSNVRLEGVRHLVEGEGAQGAPYGGFVNVQFCANVVVTGCVLTAHRCYRTIGSAGTSVTMGSYDVNVGSAVNVACVECVQTTDLADSGYWGVYTSNFCKNLLLDGCEFSRFDAHQGVHDATVRNCRIGYMGIKAVGFGLFRVENTRVEASPFFDLRSDYGSPWDGEFLVRDCVFAPPAGKTGVFVGANNAGQHDFGYPCAMPRRIVVDGLRVEDAGASAGPWLFSNYCSANTSAAYVEAFPYAPTEEVVLNRVATASGKPFRICSNAWLFRNLVLSVDVAARRRTFAAELRDGAWSELNGRWAAAPAADGRVAGSARFDVARPSAGRRTLVDGDYVADELIAPGACPREAGVGGLAASLDDAGKPCWRGLCRGTDGAPEWRMLTGAAPAAGGAYVVRVEADFAATPPRVRYAVKARGGMAFAPLTDASGGSWLVSAADARAVSAAGFRGFGATRGLEGYVAPGGLVFRMR